MIKIKRIEYIKVVYDESLSHNIFSIANITFSNFESISGALLYWQKNSDSEAYTKEGDYKFYYDMANTTYFAAVKFPKHVGLSRAQKQELAYILLEERGSVGSYSFPTIKKQLKPFSIKKEFDKLTFPNDFDSSFLPVYVKAIVPQYDLDYIEQHYAYDRAFVEAYAKWRYEAAQVHPEQLAPYKSYIDFRLLCAINPYLTELYLLEHFDEIDFQMLATNYTVLKRLSEPFLDMLVKKLEPSDGFELLRFLEEDEPLYDDYRILAQDDEDELFELDYFEYDLGSYKWPGAEHLVKGIPSFAAQAYDEYGYKKKTNKEMDIITDQFDEALWQLTSATFELHWLHRYKNKINWSICCQQNPHLNESFLMAHLSNVDFTALGLNLSCKLTPGFLDKYFNRFNHKHPVPLIIRHLNEQLYLQHKDELQLNLYLLDEFGAEIDEEQYLILQSYLCE